MSSDLKPENLLLTSPSDDADVKLVDFGFAAEAKDFTLTDQCGTPAYVAPEILYGQPYGKFFSQSFQGSQVLTFSLYCRQTGGHVVFWCDFVHPFSWVSSIF